MIVGLGNKGNTYKNTRHNIGFMVLDSLAKKLKLKFKRPFGWPANLALSEKEGVILLRPHTYMNLSGPSVKKAFDKFSLPLENLLVICDDADLPFGKLRLRKKGSSGGHKGLASVIESLGSNEFCRLRIGIGRPQGKPLEEYVLEEFLPEEKKELPQVIDKAASIVQSWIWEGTDKTMSLFN